MRVKLGSPPEGCNPISIRTHFLYKTIYWKSVNSYFQDIIFNFIYENSSEHLFICLQVKDNRKHEMTQDPVWNAIQLFTNKNNVFKNT